MSTKDSWLNEYSNALKTYKEIHSFFELNQSVDLSYDTFIPLTFAHKIKKAGDGSALWKQFIPRQVEAEKTGLIDPIGDKKKSEGNGIIKRYKNRILFTPTMNCPVICRYCFRKNELTSRDDIFKKDLKKLKSFIIKDPSINEVILTGGDPLVLADLKIQEIADLLSQTKIKYLRFHTRTPIILPKRIDDSFVVLMKNLTKKFKKIIFVLHTNHADEIDTEVEFHLKKLTNIPGLELKTQSVLLKGVNNSYEELKALFEKILEVDFTPYYLHHPDQAQGAMHFWLPLEEGRKLYNSLRSEFPGWAIPHYIIDHQSGQGKQLAFNPESFIFSGKLLNSSNLHSDFSIPE
jgi:lysine 2,3-aminomutase